MFLLAETPGAEAEFRPGPQREARLVLAVQTAEGRFRAKVPELFDAVLAGWTVQTVFNIQKLLCGAPAHQAAVQEAGAGSVFSNCFGRVKRQDADLGGMEPAERPGRDGLVLFIATDGVVHGGAAKKLPLGSVAT
ncbi:hypothetical protein QQ054_32890 [Oscillatoria amoena NRMC-F 0135]|nr:hypothetical protein [Oscillatoria amoena NRMC-F 0135]